MNTKNGNTKQIARRLFKEVMVELLKDIISFKYSEIKIDFYFAKKLLSKTLFG